MSLEAVHDLSTQDLLHVLNEKLGLERTRIRDILPSHVVPLASLESDVSTCQPILVPMDAALVSNPSGLRRSIVSRPERAMF